LHVIGYILHTNFFTKEFQSRVTDIIFRLIHGAELRVHFLKSFQKGSTCENLLQNGLKTKKDGARARVGSHGHWSLLVRACGGGAPLFWLLSQTIIQFRPHPFGHFTQ
jgi:hypothetical protein